MPNANSHAPTPARDEPDRDAHWLARAVATLGEGWAQVDAAGRVEAVAGPLFAILDLPRHQVRGSARLRELVRGLRSDDSLAWPPTPNAAGWNWTARRQDGRHVRIEAYKLAPREDARPAWLLRVRWATHVPQAIPKAATAGALYHPATRLPQQPLLLDRLQQAVERSQRTVTQRFAVVLATLAALDTLDRDSLRAVARQLEEAIRPADTVAHLDQETLAIIMEPVRGDDATVRVAVEAMVQNLRRALDDLPGGQGLGKDVAFSVAIGDGTSHPSDLLAMARTHLVRRTISHGNGPLMPEDQTGTANPAADRRPLAREREFDLRTQRPTAAVIHFAALPDPDAVIAALSDETADKEPSDGGRPGADHLVITLDQLPQFDALPRLIHLIQAWRPEAALTLELDEAAVARDPEAAIQFIDAAARRAVAIGIGRFGISQCNDSLIARLPLSRLALDPAMVADARNAAHARIRLAATIAWAHDRGLSVVATGIADKALATLVTQLGCDFARGPAFGE